MLTVVPTETTKRITTLMAVTVGLLGGGAGPLPAQHMESACPLEVPAASGELTGPGEVPEPAWDLRCIELHPAAAGGDSRGVVSLRPAPSPFGVSVTPEGRHRWLLTARLEGLPDPASLGPYTTYVAWAAPLELDPVARLGEVGDGVVELGEVDFSKYLVMISAEASADVTEREGPLVLRGRSPSSRMEPHDLLTLAPSAEEPPPERGRRGEPAEHGERGEPAPHAEHADPGEHAAHAAPSDGTHGAWSMPPRYPGVPMLPGMESLAPDVSPLTLHPDAGPGPPDAPDGLAPPRVRESEVVALPDGGTLDLTAGFVRRELKDLELDMLAFNGQHPGPLIRVEAHSTIFVNFRNETPLPTAIHWHGVRLDNRFDGVPGVTQEAVPPGGSFRYTVYFPDAGIYWYHPHHREDVQQELGLYGNLMVEAPEPDHYAPVNREEVLMLDDLLLDEGGMVPHGLEAANFGLMGRFGNLLLVNGRPEHRVRARRGEVVRFHLTNAASTRTFNLSFRRVHRDPPGEEPAGNPPEEGGDGAAAPADGAVLPVKVLATDVGRFEREVMVESVVLAPAERYVVDVLFEEPGEYEIVNHVQGINHRMGVFLEERTPLGTVTVEDRAPAEDHREAFQELRANEKVTAEIDRYRDRFDAPVDHELVLALDAEDLPLVVEEAMRYDWVYPHPVEWTGTMPMMNWALSARDLRWTLREPATGRENMDIDWRFRVGDVVKIRIHNDRSGVHAMHHPIHVHGQRFLVLEQDGVANPNLAWKDTVLLPPGSTTDILLEISNPGRWMVHCHIAEHLEAGMKFVFDAEGT